MLEGMEGVSTLASEVDLGILVVIGLSIAIFVLVVGVMFYFMYKYSSKRASRQDIQNIEHNTPLEITWTLTPTILLAVMFYYGYTDYSNLRNTKEFDEEYSVVAKMWDWDFKYENGVITDTLYVPVGKTLKFNITSLDVLHSFYLPAFRIKEDVVPGRTGFVVITPLKTGIYDIACAEYCGVNHWNMYKKFVVLEQDEYYAWVESQGGTEENSNTVEEKPVETESEEISENSVN